MVNPSILLVPLAFSTVFGALNRRYEWKYIDYTWESSEQRQNAIDSGNYVSANIFTIDVDKSPDGRVFVTTPSYPGVPATLSTISNEVGPGGPLLQPYPDWSWHRKTDCNGIISVFRVAIDKCGNLYVLDNGKNGDNQLCPAQLVIFNTQNDGLIKRVIIPTEYAANANGTSLLINLVVDTHGPQCELIKVYMADVVGYGLVTWDGRDLRRYNSPTFNGVEAHATFTIKGQSFYLTDGIFALALQPSRTPSESKRLYYRPLASLKQHYVNTDQLRGHGRVRERNYKTLNYTFSTQVSIEAFSKDGILFFGLVGPTSIACWNSHKPLNDQNVVTLAQDSETLQFASGMKTKRNELWVMTIPYQKIATGTLDITETNFIILVDPDIRSTVADTECQPWW